MRITKRNATSDLAYAFLSRDLLDNLSETDKKYHEEFLPILKSIVFREYYKLPRNMFAGYSVDVDDAISFCSIYLFKFIKSNKDILNDIVIVKGRLSYQIRYWILQMVEIMRANQQNNTFEFWGEDLDKIYDQETNLIYYQSSPNVLIRLEEYNKLKNTFNSMTKDEQLKELLNIVKYGNDTETKEIAREIALDIMNGGTW